MHKVVIMLFALSFAHIASAQEPADASPQYTGKVVKGKVAANATPKELEFSVEQMKEQMLAAQEAQLPFRAKTLELLMKTQLKVLADPETSEQLARYIHGLYENLIKEGFSKEDALQIASRLAFPVTPSVSPY